jgi:hypothetical protein
LKEVEMSGEPERGTTWSKCYLPDTPTRGCLDVWQMKYR